MGRGLGLMLSNSRFCVHVGHISCFRLHLPCKVVVMMLCALQGPPLPESVTVLDLCLQLGVAELAWNQEIRNFALTHFNLLQHFALLTISYLIEHVCHPTDSGDQHIHPSFVRRAFRQPPNASNARSQSAAFPASRWSAVACLRDPNNVRCQWRGHGNWQGSDVHQNLRP